MKDFWQSLPFLALCFFAFLEKSGGQTFQLAAPRIESGEVFFEKKTTVKIRFAMEGAAIHYTLDGSQPTRQSPVYRKPLVLKKSATVRAISAHPDYRESEPASARFFKTNPKIKVKKVETFRPASPEYPANGSATLFDLKKAKPDFSDRNWLGYRGDSMLVEVVFAEKTAIRGLTISLCSSPGSWIFPPSEIEIRGGTLQNPNVWVWQKSDFEKMEVVDNQLFVPMRLPRKKKIEQLKIKVKPFGPLPENHPGKGEQAWLFLDEILFN